MSQSRTTGTAICVELPTGERLLAVDIHIECPACGVHTVRIAGHHLQAIRTFLTETIDEYPELTLKEGDLIVSKRLAFTGTAPADPGSN